VLELASFSQLFARTARTIAIRSPEGIRIGVLMTSKAMRLTGILGSDAIACQDVLVVGLETQVIQEVDTPAMRA